MGWILSIAVAATVAGQPVSDEQVAHWSQAKGGAANALTFLVRSRWTELEAQERGVEVSDETARDAADPPAPPLSRQDALYESRIILLRAGIQDQITQPAAQSVTPDQVHAYVDAHPKSMPEARKIRLVRTRTRRQAVTAQRQLEHGLSWTSASKRYAGGGTTTVQANDERFPRRTTQAIFKARRNQTRTTGTTVFRVVEVIPPRPMNRAQQEAQAWEILSSEAQRKAIDAFEGAFSAKWRQQTSCAANYATAAVCGT